MAASEVILRIERARDGDRTHVGSLEGYCTTTVLLSHY